MQIHSLVLDSLGEEEYALIGVHTTLEDYKLAYLLNKNLKTSFFKSKEDVIFEELNKKSSFALYNCANNKYDFEWFLLANSAKTENQKVSSSLLISSETRTYLIPEKKKIDFFIKITGDVQYHFIADTIQKIKKIEQIITSYPIDKDTLKSKDALIF